MPPRNEPTSLRVTDSSCLRVKKEVITKIPLLFTLLSRKVGRLLFGK